jgi:hypothetical protein
MAAEPTTTKATKAREGHEGFLISGFVTFAFIFATFVIAI